VAWNFIFVCLKPLLRAVRNMFKKRTAANRHKRTRDSDGDDEEEGRETKLNDLRMMQKARSGNRGVQNMPMVQEEVVEAADSSEDEGGLLNMNKHFGSTGTSRSSQVVDKHLEKYLQEQLAELTPSVDKQNVDTIDDVSKQKREERKREEQSIYIIPKEWSAKEFEIEKSEEMTWQQGLAEVPLDVTFRMKNIERTESAKRKLLEARRRGLCDDGAKRREVAMASAFGDRFRNAVDAREEPRLSNPVAGETLTGGPNTGSSSLVQEYLKGSDGAAKPSTL